ncbi:19282_t:CDS:2, partial [Funneliformis geosporum]
MTELRQINKQEFLQELQKRLHDKQLTEQAVAKILEENLKNMSKKELNEREQIQKVLNVASKKNNGEIGKPDLIYYNAENNLLILGEVKPSINFHKSKILSEPVPIKYCVDGIIHYLNCFDRNHLLKYYKKHELEEILAKIKDLKLIGLAATDDRRNGIKKISTFSAEYKDNVSFAIDIDPVLDVKTFLNEEDYLNIFAKKSNDYKNMVNEVDKVSNEVNNMLRSIDSQFRPIVLSGGIISLFTNDTDNNFKDNFNNLDKESLFEDFFASIKENLKK